MNMRTVLEGLDQTLQTHPRRVAIYWGDEKITYRALENHIRTFASNLRLQTSLTPGARIGILLRNCPEFIYTLYAILKSGAVAVPINTFLKAPEVQHIATDCQLAALVAGLEFAEVTAKLAGVPVIPVSALAAPSTTQPAWSHPKPTDLAVIIYTSGTTGRSKGAMLTHANFAGNVKSCIEALEETPRDRMTLLLPMFHSFMLTVCIFTPLSMGAGIVLIKSVQPFKLALREKIGRAHV